MSSDAGKALIFVAHGSEEIETLTAFDVLVRAGFKTTLALVHSDSPLDATDVKAHKLGVQLSRGTVIIADIEAESVGQTEGYNVVVIPGGAKGAETLAGSTLVTKFVKKAHGEGRLIGMICAGSLVAKAADIEKGEKITSHPSVRKDLEGAYEYSEERVVITKNLITSRGPGTALLFALTLVEQSLGKAKRQEVEGPMICSEKL